MNPRFVKMASDSFVETIRLRLSAVSIFKEDYSTCTKDAGNKLLCSWLLEVGAPNIPKVKVKLRAYFLTYIQRKIGI